jgi:hypothetical protein
LTAPGSAKLSLSRAMSRAMWSAYVWLASAAVSSYISAARIAYRWERNGSATNRHRSPPAVVPVISSSSGLSRIAPRSTIPAASAHGRSASSAGPLSWLPPIATTCAPVCRNADSARVTTRVESGVGAPVS